MLKYVIGNHSVTGYKLPIVFPMELTHAHMGAVLKIHKCMIWSAGFVHKNKEGKWVVPMDKKSESLNIGPKKGDVRILSYLLSKGLTSLEIANLETYRRIQKGKKP